MNAVLVEPGGYAMINRALIEMLKIQKVKEPIFAYIRLVTRYLECLFST